MPSGDLSAHLSALPATRDIVDAQIHTWSWRDDPAYPWDPSFPPVGFIHPDAAPDNVDKVIADMDGAGVDAAILVVPHVYGSDNAYAIDAAHAHPDRLAVVARVDWRSAEPRRRLAELLSDDVVVGLRLTKHKAPELWQADGEFEPMLAAAEQLDVPVMVYPGGDFLSVLSGVARRHPDLRLVIDHLGLEPPSLSSAPPVPGPFKQLPNLLGLAEHPNIFVKMTAAPALSSESYPFRDIWEPVARVVSAFGVERVMWGSDYNRTSRLHSYREAVAYLGEMDRFDEATRRGLYAESARMVYAWPRPTEARGGQALDESFSAMNDRHEPIGNR